MKQPRKSELGGARFLDLSGTAIEDQRMSEPAGRTAARQTMQDADGKAGAVGLEKVDVEAPRRCLRLGRGRRAQSGPRCRRT